MSPGAPQDGAHDGAEGAENLESERIARLVAVGTMVAGFAHEVRNPVAALRSLTESLAEDLADRDLRMPQIPRMMTVLDRIERLVRTSLQAGRPDPPRRGRHRPWELASDALATLGPRTRALGGAIRVEIEPDLPDVRLDRAQVTQALVVLLDNALDAAGAPRGVQLRVGGGAGAASPDGARARASGEVHFQVVDVGDGIAPDVMPRIFDPFFTTKASGTGLGLSIAQQLVTENGGRLEVSSRRGGPTAFTITFAAHRGDGGEITRCPSAGSRGG